VFRLRDYRLICGTESTVIVAMSPCIVTVHECGARFMAPNARHSGMVLRVGLVGPSTRKTPGVARGLSMRHATRPRNGFGGLDEFSLDTFEVSGMSLHDGTQRVTV
jgi:hypothetical protein